MDDADLLRLVRMKGLAQWSLLAASACASDDEVAASGSSLIAAGLLVELSGRVRLTSGGRERYAELVARERSAIDALALQAAYHDFCILNADLKTIISDWQARDDRLGADRGEEANGLAVAKRLSDLHRAFLPLADRLSEVRPRLDGYRRRLSEALAHIDAGELEYVSRPIIDSYHTIWFELHEDLLEMSGLSRSDEAAAGRAA